MAQFYAIVLDWDFGSGTSTLQLIDSGTSRSQLQSTTDYDPSADCSQVLRSKFSVSQTDDHPITNRFTGNANSAHICRLTAL